MRNEYCQLILNIKFLGRQENVYTKILTLIYTFL